MDETGEQEEMALSCTAFIDYYLTSATFLTEFHDKLERDYEVGDSGRIGYVSGISDLLDYHKFQSVAPSVLQNFSVTEVYIKRGRKCIAKNMRSHWTTDLDVETLESRRSWASLNELQKVVPFHLPRYELMFEKCTDVPSLVTATDLTFATRFIAAFMFIKVKGCRPMTYQHLSVKMFESAQRNNGLVDQKVFKTAKTYGFNCLYFDTISLEIVGKYVAHVRPLLKPTCDYLLVNRNGKQFKKLTELLSVLVFQAIGKHIPPTRYRQIIETESSQSLDSDEQKWISEDQKHSSHVARVHYQKKRSRDIAMKGRICMDKLRGDEGKAMDQYVQQQLNKKRIKRSDVDGLSNDSDEKNAEETHEPRLNKTEPMEEQSQRTPNSTKKRNALKYDRHTKKKIVRFTKEEDDSIKKGIEMFGTGWAKMLVHPDFVFHPIRVPNSLRKRAELLKLV